MNLERAEELARELMWDNGLEEWSFVYDNAKRRAGQCSYVEKEISLSRSLTEICSEDEVLSTILHEIAHALTDSRVGHGPAWRRMVTQLGGSPERCYSATENVQDHLEKSSKYHTVCPICGEKYHAMRRLSKFSERYCIGSAECKAKNRVKETRVYLVWYENTKYGPVRAHD